MTMLLTQLQRLGCLGQLRPAAGGFSLRALHSTGRSGQLFRNALKLQVKPEAFTSRKPGQFQNILFRRLAASEASSATVSADAAALARQNRLIGYWLAGTAGLTFATVCIGGLTRLTESGLSMVDWHPFKEVPPRGADAWQAEFEKYQQYPEWRVKNREITLEQFKFIWHMEYGHRTLGRLIGAVYFLPMAVFWSRGWFTRGLKVRSVIFGSLLAFQGVLGWYMVKSGLEESQLTSGHQPRVSQYRLAAHLGTAMAFYSLLFWNALTTLVPAPPPTSLPALSSGLLRFKRLAGTSKLLVFTTALSGAFVAGLDAGLHYNTWPLMADRWIPSDLIKRDGGVTPWWRNAFENATTVQFNHRHLAEATALFILGAWAYSLRLPLPRRARIASHLLAATVLGQATLGICTLLWAVPTELAAAHQAGALTTLSVALWLSTELRWIKRLPK